MPKPWEPKPNGRYTVTLYHGGEAQASVSYDDAHLAWAKGKDWLMGHAGRTPADWKLGYSYQIYDNDLKQIAAKSITQH